MKYFFYIFTLYSLGIFSQEKNMPFVDNKYYEDQFYVGVSYISLANTVNDIENIGIPYSFTAGFIKDIPLNKQRNIALGLGLGYAYNNLKPNIAIINSDLDISITNNYSDYQYKSHNLEIPFEFRWRTSTATKYRFWRIYSGVSLIYNFKTNADFEIDEQTTTYNNLNLFREYNSSIYTSVGFGTWNFHIKYYLQSFFKNNITSIDNKSLQFKPLMMGVMFYLM